MTSYSQSCSQFKNAADCSQATNCSWKTTTIICGGLSQEDCLEHTYGGSSTSSGNSNVNVGAAVGITFAFLVIVGGAVAVYFVHKRKKDNMPNTNGNSVGSKEANEPIKEEEPGVAQGSEVGSLEAAIELAEIACASHKSTVANIEK